MDTKHFAGEVKEILKEGQESAKKIAADIDQRIKENPWTVLGSIALISFLTGLVMGMRKNSK